MELNINKNVMVILYFNILVLKTKRNRVHKGEECTELLFGGILYLFCLFIFWVLTLYPQVAWNLLYEQKLTVHALGAYQHTHLGVQLYQSVMVSNIHLGTTLD